MSVECAGQVLVRWPPGSARPSSSLAVEVPPSPPGYHVWSTEETLESHGIRVGTSVLETTTVWWLAAAICWISAVGAASNELTSGEVMSFSVTHLQSANTSTLAACLAAAAAGLVGGRAGEGEAEARPVRAPALAGGRRRAQNEAAGAVQLIWIWCMPGLSAPAWYMQLARPRSM